MSKYLTIALLLATLSLMAQDTEKKKNQIRVGYGGFQILGEGYPMSFYNFWTPRWSFEPNLEYRRRISTKHSIAGSYGFFIHIPNFQPALLIPDSTLAGRHYRVINLSYLYSLLQIGRFEVSVAAESGYRFDASEDYHAFFLNNGRWLEGITYGHQINAFSLGLSTDLMFRLKWGLFLHGKVGYHRYFSEYAPNELRVVLGAGWEF